MRVDRIEYLQEQPGEYTPPAPQWALAPTSGRLDYTTRGGRREVTGATGVGVAVKSGPAYENATHESTVLQVTWNDGESTRSVALVMTPEDAEALAQQLHACVMNGLTVRHNLIRAALAERITSVQKARGVFNAAVDAVRGTQVLIGTPDTTMPQRLWDRLVRALDAFDKSWRSPEYKTDHKGESNAVQP